MSSSQLQFTLFLQASFLPDSNAIGGQSESVCCAQEEVEALTYEEENTVRHMPWWLHHKGPEKAPVLCIS